MGKLAELMGRPFMPWQQQCVDVALEVDDVTGRFAYKLVVVTVPRQSGKTTMFGAVMEHRAMTTTRGRVWFTAQSGKDAVDWLQNEHVPMLQPFAGIFHLRRSAGSDWVRWPSGGMVRPFPPTPDGLHGKLSDLVVVDEPWAFDIQHGRAIDQAIAPTQATRPNAQVWKVSTAGDASSTWWLGTVEAGRAAVRAGRREGVAYFEWSCPDHLDPTDAGSWPQYHPAFGRTIEAPAMVAALELLGPDEFARAYGNRWVSTTARIIPAGAWVAAGDDKAPLPPPGGLCLGFDAALDRSDACIVAAWTDDAGVGRLEVADWREGAGWVADRVVELAGKWAPRAIGWNKAGPARDIGDEIERRGVTLLEVGTGDFAAACSGFLEAVIAVPPKLRYRPHQSLDDAAAAATSRPIGDAWAWGRRAAVVSLAPLTAATVARWADLHSTPSGPFRIF